MKDCQVGDFLDPVTELTVQQCVQNFVRRTSNAELRQVVCMCCARQVFAKSSREMTLEDIPHPHLLRPSELHPAMQLHYGMLLQVDSDAKSGHVCCECLAELETKKRTPSLALANNMWIGDVPFVLQILTLPEQVSQTPMSKDKLIQQLTQVLISLYYTAAYIVKLYPKKRGARHWNNELFTQALSGNVSTYQMNNSQIEEMASGTLLPRSPSILSSLIGITIVGPKNIPEKTMRGQFTVRRYRVADAIRWLKQNNRIYSGVNISKAALEQLPENDVPVELINIIQTCPDTTESERERAGYVPDDEDDTETPQTEYRAGSIAKNEPQCNNEEAGSDDDDYVLVDGQSKCYEN